MVYQSLQADIYLEGDIATALGMLAEAVQTSDRIDPARVKDRKSRWEDEHHKLHEGYRSSVAAAQEKQPIDPVWLCAAISEAMPQDAIYVDETIVHRPLF
jgi:thiamine pyrophosphate-dependent acetolactate synthase large subunit-like protein